LQWLRLHLDFIVRTANLQNEIDGASVVDAELNARLGDALESRRFCADVVMTDGEERSHILAAAGGGQASHRDALIGARHRDSRIRYHCTTRVCDVARNRGGNFLGSAVGGEEKE
jgi:hypothetical protein